jgi:hypothetical protein
MFSAKRPMTALRLFEILVDRTIHVSALPLSTLVWLHMMKVNGKLLFAHALN